MLITFQITLIFVIVVSLIYAFDSKSPKDFRLHGVLLCIVGILVYTYSLVVL